LGSNRRLERFLSGCEPHAYTDARDTHADTCGESDAYCRAIAYSECDTARNTYADTHSGVAGH
jgi:hypothetical protein